MIEWVVAGHAFGRRPGFWTRTNTARDQRRILWPDPRAACGDRGGTRNPRFRCANARSHVRNPARFTVWQIGWGNITHISDSVLRRVSCARPCASVTLPALSLKKERHHPGHTALSVLIKWWFGQNGPTPYASCAVEESGGKGFADHEGTTADH